MKRQKIFYLLIVFVLFFYACNSPRFVHTPTALNNPFFTEKNQSKVAIYTSGGSVSGDNGPVRNITRGYDLMGAYAVSNHFAITASYHRRRERNFYLPYRTGPFDSSYIKYTRNLWEAGAGYFTTLNPAGTITANLYAGLGNGKYMIADTGRIASVKYERYYNTSVSKIYLQPSLNFIFSTIRIGLIYRMNILTYKNLVTSYNEDELIKLRLDNLNNKTLLFNEPGLNFQAGHPAWPWLLIEGQVSFNFNDDRYYRSRTSNFSAGLLIDPVGLLKKK